jgi:uncharacterized membrane protein YphA (DoxX/SURF4 family)
MDWPAMPSAEPRARDRARLSPLARAAAAMPREPRPQLHPALLVALALIAPAVAFAHERWVPNTPRFPVNRAYFQSMTGEVLLFSLLGSFAVFGVIVLWYLSAPGLVDALTPITPSARAREAARPLVVRAVRSAVRFFLDGATESAFMRHGLVVAEFIFGRIPALVLVLGAYQGWLVMPSYPLPVGDVGDALRIVSLILALWILTGLFRPALGAVLFLVFGYLCFAYGIAGIDAIPVLASAFYYLFAKKGTRGVNAAQLLGMRVSLGFGFFLLGLVNKIFLAPELFIGVGDQHPELLIGPQAMFPWLTREAWSFTTALGEMVFGLLLLFGVFSRVSTLILTFVFANFILVFGLDEVVHVYPIAGFLLLFFRGSLGSSLDGIVFRQNLRIWRWLRHTSSQVIYSGAVTSVAGAAAALMMFLPLVLIVEVVPVLADTAVPSGYRAPAPPPPASAWPPASAPLPSDKPHADHAPRHGGVVTMSGDLHVETVVSPSGGVFLYPSDAQRAPIPPGEAQGTIRIERPGFKSTLPLRPDPASGALTVAGPPPRLAADYTYSLQIRRVPLSSTLTVPPGGTDSLVKRPGGAWTSPSSGR